MEIEIDAIKEYLEYSTDSPSLIKWKKDKCGSKAGDPAGYQRSGITKAFRIELNRKNYSAKSIIFLLSTGILYETNAIKNIDGNIENNSIDNLAIDQSYISTGVMDIVVTAREASAKRTGYEYISHIDGKKHKGLYRRIECGHARVLSHSNINDGIVACKDCVREGHVKLVESLGMEFISFERPNNKGTLYVNVNLSCGHPKLIQIGNLLNGIYKCNTCWLEKVNNIAGKFGIRAIKNIKENDWLCELPCGCEKTLRINNLQKGSWSCETHKDHYAYWPSKVYLVRITTEFLDIIKLGVSSKTSLRVLQYGIDVPHTVDVLKELDFSTGAEAVKFEKSIHTKFRNQRINPDDLRGVLKLSGFTECYPLNMLETLTKELNGN